MASRVHDKILSYENYVKQYSSLAVQQQKKYRIPASITLAQGILESGAGQSELARKSNNHFGIKCHTEWKGEKVYHNDDLANECFRKYKSVEGSYEDHALFLTERSRYAHLFKLDIKDYKGWAKGLQESGYATDQAYANRLIKLIEDYRLYLYDSNQAIADKKEDKKEDKKADKKIKKPSQKKTKIAFVIKRPVYDGHGLRYVLAENNDNFERLAEDTGLSAEELRKFNEVPEDFPLQKGDIIYLEKKKRKADKPNYDHVVQIGESMHSISQKYGVQITNLYKINKKKEDYVPIEGDVLKLR
ncbi:MAG: glucosaminidase domain-containing protein [Tannerellaceae bacterium]|nr:glucosaminidase domain-containing protein [Tannerellaceae bacterium]